MPYRNDISHNRAAHGKPARRKPPLYVLLIAVFLALVAIAFCLVQCSQCSSGTVQAGDGDTMQDPASNYQSPYVWDRLQRDGTRWSYVADGRVLSRIGIDVSESQHGIDWNAVATDGIDFAYIRLGYRGATEGYLYRDAYFDQNLAGARAAGLDCGVYFFSQATSVEEAYEEAEFVLEALGGVPLQYPIAYDSEVVQLKEGTSRTVGISNDDMTAFMHAFCERIEAAGYKTIVYGNRHDLGRYNYRDLQRLDIWWAEYGSQTPHANVDMVMWQYANSGQVAGVSTYVDMDIDLREALAYERR